MLWISLYGQDRSLSQATKSFLFRSCILVNVSRNVFYFDFGYFCVILERVSLVNPRFRVYGAVISQVWSWGVTEVGIRAEVMKTEAVEL